MVLVRTNDAERAGEQGLSQDEMAGTVGPERSVRFTLLAVDHVSRVGVRLDPNMDLDPHRFLVVLGQACT